MRAAKPGPEQAAQLLELWKDAFGAYNGFWEMFLTTAFSPERCRCLCRDGRILAALTWMDVWYRGQKMAYVYAVATHRAYRGQGLCRLLLEQTHGQLKALGYGAALLVPGDAGLRAFYRKSGYETCTTVTEFAIAAYGEQLPLRAIGPQEYAALRRQFLPENGVVQEGENLTFLGEQAQFYQGEGCLLAAWQEDGILNVLEFLGDASLASRVVKSLGCWEGRFRMPGGEKPFAMGIGLQKDASLPGYFGFAFD